MAKLNNIRLQIGRWWVPIPRVIWQRMVARAVHETRQQVTSLEADYHRVRDFVVVELPKVGESLSPGTLASRLDMPLPKVEQILDELERGKIFLYRNRFGEVDWAYPVTAGPTNHQATLTSGEKTWAA